MDWSPPGSSVHGVLQARILEWVAISFSKFDNTFLFFNKPFQEQGTQGNESMSLMKTLAQNLNFSRKLIMKTKLAQNVYIYDPQWDPQLNHWPLEDEELQIFWKKHHLPTSWISLETDSPHSLQKGIQPRWHLDFSLMRLLSRESGEPTVLRFPTAKRWATKFVML